MRAISHQIEKYYRKHTHTNTHTHAERRKVHHTTQLISIFTQNFWRDLITNNYMHNKLCQVVCIIQFTRPAQHKQQMIDGFVWCELCALEKRWKYLIILKKKIKWKKKELWKNNRVFCYNKFIATQPQKLGWLFCFCCFCCVSRNVTFDMTKNIN